MEKFFDLLIEDLQKFHEEFLEKGIVCFVDGDKGTILIQFRQSAAA